MGSLHSYGGSEVNAMSEIATELELELYWRRWGYSGYQRVLPAGQTVTVNKDPRYWWVVSIDGVDRSSHGQLETAIAAAGRIAREQLADEARTWA